MAEEREVELKEAYRDPALRGEPGPGEPATELHYFPEGPKHRSTVVVSWMFLLPLLVGAVVAGLLGSGWGIVLGPLVLFGVWQWQKRRQRTVPRATLRVVSGRLHLSGPAFHVPAAMDLADLLDVYLDTKTVQPVEENMSTMPELRFLQSRVGASRDEARIALECKLETYFLTEQRTSHLDSSEWFSKIRRFLRKQGWVPEDERPV